MLSFLAAICGTGSKIQPIWNIVNFIINAIMIGVPILLILFGMVDLGKAVIASKEDEVKKATKAFGKRFLYAVGVFAVVWLVTFILSTVAETAKIDENYTLDENSWQYCWRCNIRGKNNSETCEKAARDLNIVD